ncbi:tripartite tricarboxylate transporter TctB family protein [Testudinibacter sp. P80/BLE/0925]|uniref:tripartite tricarboxylate transporter TctB family protein n=1 Tax=Testudinibacter sp. TW-1 TaxID=3417757 RepID=UPI003D35E82F
MKKYFSNQNFMAGFIFFFVAILYLISSFFINTKNVVSVEADFMPKIYGGLLLITSIALMLTSYIKIKDSPVKKEKKQADWKRIFAILALIFVYILLIQYVGFVLVSMPFLFFLALMLTPDYIQKRLWIYIIFSIMLPIIANFLFSHYLNLTMPSGILF